MNLKNVILMGLAILCVLLIAALVTVIRVTAPDPKYYCEARDLEKSCEYLTNDYGLPNGKCLHKEYGNFRCESGWEEIERRFKMGWYKEERFAIPYNLEVLQ